MDVLCAHSDHPRKYSEQTRSTSRTVHENQVLQCVQIVPCEHVGGNLCRRDSTKCVGKVAGCLFQDILDPGERLAKVVHLSQHRLGGHFRTPDRCDIHQRLGDLHVQILGRHTTHLLGLKIPALSNPGWDNPQVLLMANCTKITAQVVAVAVRIAEEGRGCESLFTTRATSPLHRQLRTLREARPHLQLPVKMYAKGHRAGGTGNLAFSDNGGTRRIL